MLECDNRGIAYKVEKTYTNGVRAGSLPTHPDKKKQNGGQLWFPSDWDDDKVRAAGTFVANKKETAISEYLSIWEYDGVRVRVMYDGGEIKTVCPDYDQNLVEGVTLL